MVVDTELVHKDEENLFNSSTMGGGGKALFYPMISISEMALLFEDSQGSPLGPSDKSST